MINFEKNLAILSQWNGDEYGESNVEYRLNKDYEWSDVDGIENLNYYLKGTDLRLKEKVEYFEDLCEHCGGAGADYMVNPYDADINGIENWQFICPSCYENLCGDI